jgi:UDP-glucose 4-epimerase
MKILVTGAGGRLGASLKQSLRVSGDLDSVFVGSPRSRVQSRGPVLDVTDRAAVGAIIAETKPDVIVHLASLAGAVCDVDPARTRSVNVDAVRWVSEAAIQNGVSRIVFASTGGVYGSNYSTPVDESATLDLATTYAQSKFEAEEVLRAAAAEDPQTKTVILRIFNVYGTAFDESLVSRLIHSTSEAPTALVGFDHFVRDYSEVSAVVAAVRASSRATLLTASSTFNIGSGDPLSTRRLIEMIDRPVSYTVDGDAHSYSCANITAARSVLGFVPSIPEIDVRNFAASEFAADHSVG